MAKSMTHTKAMKATKAAGEKAAEPAPAQKEMKAMKSKASVFNSFSSCVWRTPINLCYTPDFDNSSGAL